MKTEKARYIILHFPNLLTTQERIAIRHHTSVFKLGENPSPIRTKLYKEKGWLSDDPAVLTLLKDGYEKFELSTAQRIMAENREKVYFNNCPLCGRLTRTPQARQCRYCRHDWHAIIAAKFKLNSSFQLAERQFFLVGEIVNGEVKVGDYLDLTMIGLNCKPKIEVIEFALKKIAGKTMEDMAFGTNELSEEQKTHLKKLSSFGTPFDIVKAR